MADIAKYKVQNVEHVINWITDSFLDARLKNLGLKYKIVPNISLKQVNWEKSLQRNVRFGEALLKEHIETLALKMEAGSPFIMPVFIRDSAAQKAKRDDEYLILAGNNRFAAVRIWQMDEGLISAYVVDLASDPVDVDTFAYRDNTDGAVAPTRHEACIQTIELAIRHDLTLDEAAKRMGTPAARVKELARQRKTEEALASVGVDTRKLTASAMVALSPIKDSLPVLKKSAELFIAYGPRTKDFHSSIMDVKAVGTEQGRLATLDDYERKLQETSKVRQQIARKQRHAGTKNQAYKRFKLAFNQIEEVLMHGAPGRRKLSSQSQLQLPIDEPPLLWDKWLEMHKVMTGLFKGSK